MKDSKSSTKSQNSTSKDKTTDSNKELNKSKTPDESKNELKESYIDSGSGFSEGTEKIFQDKMLKKREKERKIIDKLHNVMKKGFMPPVNNEEKKGRWSDLKVRTIWAVVMTLSFFFILAMGHLYSAILVGLIIICINYELTDLPVFKDRNDEIKNYRFNSWFIFSVGIYYLYVKTIIKKVQFLNKYPLFYFLLRYHSFICFMLYCFSFFLFIISLKKGYYKYQFRQFAYVHIILFIFGFFSSLIISNIFNGLVWFLLPASCVVMNDITAYMWGRFLGKHQLCSLSPKKTWEGFIGGFISTMVWAFFFSLLLLQFDYLLCPSEEIEWKPFVELWKKCSGDELKKLYQISFSILGKHFIFKIRAIQIHGLVLSLFAGSIAPLGGLFASGFKRAINIKDFANTIPGHGGLTDRMDCELLMGVFTYVYLKQFVFFDEKKMLINLLHKIAKLDDNDKYYIYENLKKMLGF